MPINRLKLCLDDHKVKYVTIKRSLAYTAQEIAESAHIQGRELAKTVMVNIDGKMAYTDFERLVQPKVAKLTTAH